MLASITEFSSTRATKECATPMIKFSLLPSLISFHCLFTWPSFLLAAFFPARRTLQHNGIINAVRSADIFIKNAYTRMYI